MKHVWMLLLWVGLMGMAVNLHALDATSSQAKPSSERASQIQPVNKTTTSNPTDVGATKTSLVTATLGEMAPDFDLPSSEKSQVSLSQFKGKYVVLEWTNFGCPFVKKFYDGGAMQQMQKDWTGKGVVWLSICSSAPGKEGHMPADKAHEVVMKKQKSNATVYLLDENGTVGQMYGAKTTPHMFVIDPEGKLIYAGAIDDKPSTKSADLRGANNYVTQALEEAMKGKAVSVPTTQPYGCGVKYSFPSKPMAGY